jgi:chemotaxis protein MotB
MSTRVPRTRASHERWLVSYADFITLLFAFFVVLYAFAKADQRKQAQVSVSIDTAFKSLSVLPNNSKSDLRRQWDVASGEPVAQPSRTIVREQILTPTDVRLDLDQVRRNLESMLSVPMAQRSISIHMGRNGLVISLREAGFFESGSARLRPESLQTVHEIIHSLSQTPYDIRIEGHTDNIPIHNSEFNSNWELSSLRATGLVRLFLENRDISPYRLSSAGYAEFHPVASNSTVEGRAENRRVDLVVMPRSAFDLATPLPAKLKGPWRRITDE